MYFYKFYFFKLNLKFRQLIFFLSSVRQMYLNGSAVIKHVGDSLVHQITVRENSVQHLITKLEIICRINKW